MADGTATLRNRLFEEAARVTPVYLALYSDASTELAPTGYVRKAVTFPAPADGVGANSVAVTFDAFTGAGGPITHAALFDASSAGNRLTAIKALGGGAASWTDSVPVIFPIGTITFEVA